VRLHFVPCWPITQFLIYLTLGGSTISSPASLPLQLDGSSSKDTNSKISVATNLTYNWVCVILTVSQYLDDCQLFSAAEGSGNTLTIPKFSMQTSLLYQISLLVTASDSRYGIATVLVYPSSSTIIIDGMSGPSQANVDRRLPVFGQVSAKLAVNATWTAVWGFAELPLSVDSNALTPPNHHFSAESAAQTIVFALGAAADAFIAGRTYTFRLSGCEFDSITACSYSQLDVRINGPPVSGSLLVSPSFGAALEMPFEMSSIDWSDEITDYPLQYSFFYQLASSTPPMAIQSYGVVTYAVAVLPAGLSFREYLVSVIGLVADNYGCATSATVSVKVNGSDTNDTVNLLQGSVSSFSATLDTDGLSQVLNPVSTTLNSVNCSGAPDCNTLNREHCIATVNTCGSCMSGYVGVVGDSNKLCFSNTSNSGAVGFPCIADVDCIYGHCSFGVCAPPPLRCVSNCSSAGLCKFVDSANNELASCTIFDVGCSAMCVCNNGFNGQDCSLTDDDLAVRDSSRAQMCDAFLTAAKLQDNSSNLLDTMVTSLLAAYSPYEVMAGGDSQARCSALLSYLSSVGRQGYIANALSTTVQFLTNTVSSFVTGAAVQQRRRLTAENDTSVADAVDDMITGLTTGLLGGESPTTITSDNVRLSVMSPLTSSLYNSTLSPPATEAESQYGALLPSVSLAEAGLDACGFSDGYAPMSILSWGTNPYHTQNPLQSSLLRIGTGGAIASSRRLLETIVTSNLSFVPQYYISLQFSSPLTLNFTAQRLNGITNYTLPECTFYDGTEYTACEGCNISSYTDYNVTYACHDINVLCGDVASSRRHSRRLASDGTTVASYGALATSIAGEVVNVLSVNPFTSKASAVLAFISVLLFVFLVGIVLLIRWDSFEHNSFVYIRGGAEEGLGVCVGDEMSLTDVVDKSFSNSFLYRFTSKASLYSASPVRKNSWMAFAGLGNPAISADDGADDDDLSFQAWHRAASTEDPDLKKKVDSFLDVVLPSETLLVNGSLWLRCLLFMKSKHEYIDFFTEFNPNLSRCVRWIGLWKGILINLFIDTLFFGVYFPDGGICDGYVTEAGCEASLSSVSSTGTTCVWDNNTESCGLAPPPESPVFAITLALICTIVCVPLEFVMTYVLEEFAAKWPDLNSVGLSTATWFGSYRFPRFCEPSHTESGLSAVQASPLVSAAAAAEKSALTALLYDDLKSPEEEMQSILASVRRYFSSDVQLPDEQISCHGSQPSDLFVRMERLGVLCNGEFAPLTMLQLIKYRTASNRLLCMLKETRKVTNEVVDGLGGFFLSDYRLRDYYMIQTFILEQFTLFKRFALRKHLFFYKKIAPDIIPVHEYIFGWAVIIGALMFYFYWILAWGARNGGVTLKAWGVNFAIGAAQDILVQNPVKVLILYIAAAEIMRPQLKNVHRTLYDVAMRSTRDTSQSFGFRVCQHTSPTCRAARAVGAFDLPSSRLLRLLNDKDLQICQEARITREMVVIIVIISVPAVLAVFGDTVADQLLGTVINSFTSAIALMLNYLNVFGVPVLMTPIVIIIGLLLYRYGFVRSAVNWIEAHNQSERRKIHKFRPKRTFVSEDSWTTRQLRRGCLRVLEFLSAPFSTFRKLVWTNTNQSEGKLMWQRINTVRPILTTQETGGLIKQNNPISLPEEIISLTKDSASPYEVSERLHGFHELAVCSSRQRAFRSDDSRTLMAVTTSQDVALKTVLRLFINDMDKIENLLIDDGMMSEFFRYSAEPDEQLPITRLQEALVEVWVYYWPLGVQISSLEIDQIRSCFEAWTAELNSSISDGLIPARAFVLWFRKIDSVVMRMRSSESMLRFEPRAVSTDSVDISFGSTFCRVENEDSSSDSGEDSDVCDKFSTHDLIKLGNPAVTDVNVDTLRDDEDRDDYSWYINSFKSALDTTYVANSSGESSSGEDIVWYSPVPRTYLPDARLVPHRESVMNTQVAAAHSREAGGIIITADLMADGSVVERFSPLLEPDSHAEDDDDDDDDEESEIELNDSYSWYDSSASSHTAVHSPLAQPRSAIPQSLENKLRTTGAVYVGLPLLGRLRHRSTSSSAAGVGRVSDFNPDSTFLESIPVQEELVKVTDFSQVSGTDSEQEIVDNSLVAALEVSLNAGVTNVHIREVSRAKQPLTPSGDVVTHSPVGRSSPFVDRDADTDDVSAADTKGAESDEKWYTAQASVTPEPSPSQMGELTSTIPQALERKLRTTGAVYVGLPVLGHPLLRSTYSAGTVDAPVADFISDPPLPETFPIEEVMEAPETSQVYTTHIGDALVDSVRAAPLEVSLDAQIPAAHSREAKETVESPEADAMARDATDYSSAAECQVELNNECEQHSVPTSEHTAQRSLLVQPTNIRPRLESRLRTTGAVYIGLPALGRPKLRPVPPAASGVAAASGSISELPLFESGSTEETATDTLAIVTTRSTDPPTELVADNDPDDDLSAAGNSGGDPEASINRYSTFKSSHTTQSSQFPPTPVMPQALESRLRTTGAVYVGLPLLGRPVLRRASSATAGDETVSDIILQLPHPQNIPVAAELTEIPDPRQAYGVDDEGGLDVGLELFRRSSEESLTDLQSRRDPL
jgi:hypothetical protein